MHLAVGKIPVLQLAGASRHDDTGRKLDTLDLSGQKYVSAYDRPISVLTPPLELTSIVALRPPSSAYIPTFSCPTAFREASLAMLKNKPRHVFRG